MSFVYFFNKTFIYVESKLHFTYSNWSRCCKSDSYCQNFYLQTANNDDVSILTSSRQIHDYSLLTDSFALKSAPQTS